ncbi:DNA-binding response regulator [Domibacillus antri]|uniref:DNA-binding response regulator n=1 Tax=Domibacillus antri TaxID=1714264 RepID=A0A1Q8Q481_9BACI|nr:LytTR family DNA-binding domain-containing protein [Domibacillus antri]OLN22163.1 DNA-binding response regulator [Domibacillus antri]
MIPLKILLADDHEDSLKTLENLAAKHPEFEVVSTCRNGEELVEQAAVYKPDIVITDIKMPKLNGVDAIKKCMQFHPDLKFFFVSGYGDFAVEAFNISAVDYVVKPLEKSRFYAALEKAKWAVLRNEKKLFCQKHGKKKLPLKFNGALYYVPFNDILFIEKLGKKCFVYTKEKTFETYEKISDLFELLDDSFYLSHRSNIINLNNIFYIKPKNETYLAYFLGFSKHAHISKLKIKEVHEKIQQLNE